jgi:hypothetical protein
VKHNRHRLAASALLTILAGVTSALAQEQRISCTDVPAPAREAFAKAFPKATIKGCTREIEKGRRAYEISSTEGETRRDVTFYADGTLVAVEESIPFGDVPEPVQQAVHKRYPGDEITRAEKVMRDGIVLYEFGIKHAGKAVEIVIDPGGNEVKP